MINRALKAIRQFHDLTKDELADQLNISIDKLSRIESGKAAIDLEIIKQYSDLFNISTSSIVFFSENMKKDESKLSKKIRLKVSHKILEILEWFNNK